MIMLDELNRRHFLAATMTSCAAASIVSAAETSATADNSTDQNRRVVVGVMGLSRGQELAAEFARHPNVVVKYVCDVDRQRAESGAARLKQSGSSTTQPVEDFRRILDDQEVDALVCAAPNHWHAPATILGCQARKHVYVEKPCSHNPREGEWMVEASRRHQRVVQMGTQRRSSSGTIEAMKKLHEGAIGRVYLARSWYNADRGSIGTRQPSSPPPHLNYELWQGPAPQRPFKENVVHYNWHWHWHWGNGELGNNGVHTIDLCRWGLNVDFPLAVTSSGGRYCYADDQETPDTHTVCFEFDGQRSITWHGLSCNRHEDGFVTFYGDQGTLELQSGGEYTIFDRRDKVVHRSDQGDGGQQAHVANFLSAVRAGNSSLLAAEISTGHRSTLLCHLGNIAHRVGRRLKCDASNGHIVDDAEAMRLWEREYAPEWKPTV
jgi:predicted dehydrogenase